ncbi:hypothetical protein PsorP6_007020 [Peronosclerospora sorghi]|uniref:Uncharacterized protein n=1 Tax=Peronosclerospora sorghi TaxID=230839 RepID=A0ACC0W8G6_9STRA|nr:hypothetical protein PsorP6_007020 [Peronosclerospora sorghi]
MHNTFAFTLAKSGVNGLPGVRRAATASHLGGTLSSPQSQRRRCSSYDDERSASCGTPRDGHDVAGTTTWPLRDDGRTSVDKTNPFIGYFHTTTKPRAGRARDGAPRTTTTPVVPVRRFPCRTQSSTALSSIPSLYSTACFTPQPPRTEWNRPLPTCFPPTYAQESKPYAHSRARFLDPLTLRARALGMRTPTKQDDGTRPTGPCKRTVSLPTAFESIACRGDRGTSRFEQDFDVVRTLGTGGQGSVFKVRSKVDGCYYAVKKVVLPRSTCLQQDGVETHALREVRLMASMAPHPNLVRYHTAWTETVAQGSRASDTVDSSESLALERGDEPLALTRMQMHCFDDDDALYTHSTEEAAQLFSLPHSAASLRLDEEFTPGFTFDDEMFRDGCSKDHVCFPQPSANVSSAIPRSQVVLYIQMELCGCGTAGTSSVPLSPARTYDHDPLHRLVSQFKTPQQERAQRGHEATPSTLAAWLRASLQERLALANMSTRHYEGLRLFLGAVQGVAHLHSYGVMHRDLKPENIFLHGQVAKIGDLGLSKSVLEDKTMDASVVVRAHPLQRAFRDGNHTTALGTFTYASPEQLGYHVSQDAATRCTSSSYSLKSDIFALGVILLEVCCPFVTMMERAQVLTSVRHGVVPPRARELFSREMELVLRMTSIEPSERPTSEEVCEQLRTILAASTAPITRASVVEDLHQVQKKLAAAVRSVCDRSHAVLHLEALVAELNEKVEKVGLALV